MRLGELFSSKGLAKGAYRYDGAGELKGHRMHLRVDSQQKGVLMIDAAKLVFLNGTALDYVWCLLEGKDDSATYRYMRKRYRKLRKKTAAEHYHRVREQVNRYVKGEVDVVEKLGAETPLVGADDLPAPYRMDLALTYKCQNDCGHCYNEDKDRKELGTEDWKSVIKDLWDQGIPHIVFTGGEPTLHPGLKDLVARSEEFGQITGMITNGRKLSEPGYLKELVKVGLDHVQITLLSYRESTHDRLTCSNGAWKETVEGLKVALAEDLYVSTNTTIMRDTIGEVEETMRFLVSLGVKHLAFNGIIRAGRGTDAESVSFEELASVLSKLKSMAGESGVELIWYAPTPYCEFNPVNYGLGIRQCTACSINMAIEPDGTVLPCQSYYEPLGNILTDPWDKIWNNDLCRKIRERRYAPEKCADCSLMDLCGGGCPLSIEHGDYLCMDRHSNP